MTRDLPEPPAPPAGLTKQDEKKGLFSGLFNRSKDVFKDLDIEPIVEEEIHKDDKKELKKIKKEKYNCK